MMFNVTANEPWDVDTRHLAALVAIARTTSISRAAQELGYGQSAVSQQLAALERVVGTRLVDRGVGPRPVTLTAAGEAMERHARGILQRLDAARRELDALRDGHAGHLVIGSFQSASAKLVPRVLAVFKAAWPDVTVTIHSEDFGRRVVGLLREGALDLAFVESDWDSEALSSRRLLDDRFTVVVPPGHRLAHREHISLQDLAGEHLVAGSANEPCTLRVDAALRRWGVPTETSFRTDDNTARQRMVHAGLGCSVMPNLTVERELVDGGVAIALQDDLSRTISLVWSNERTLSPAAQRFVDIALETLGPDAPDANAAPHGAVQSG